MFLKENTRVFKENIDLLHVAPEKVFYDIFRNQENINYLTADLNDKPHHVMEKMDIQDIQYPDNTFDFIYCSHVLEHVPDDRKAIDELYRVLKPNGKALIMVPLNRSLDKTLEDQSYNTPELRLKHYHQSDHLRYYGPDFTDKLEDAGFKILLDEIEFIENIDEEDIKKYGIDKIITFFYCAKPD
jgi:ubiquinone/menaquinone biosynthesis C-methylase UbiE